MVLYELIGGEDASLVGRMCQGIVLSARTCGHLRMLIVQCRSIKDASAHGHSRYVCVYFGQPRTHNKTALQRKVLHAVLVWFAGSLNVEVRNCILAAMYFAGSVHDDYEAKRVHYVVQSARSLKMFHWMSRGRIAPQDSPSLRLSKKTRSR